VREEETGKRKERTATASGVGCGASFLAPLSCFLPSYTSLVMMKTGWRLKVS
jgi:hypothetical protein